MESSTVSKSRATWHNKYDWSGLSNLVHCNVKQDLKTILRLFKQVKRDATVWYNYYANFGSSFVFGSFHIRFSLLICRMVSLLVSGGMSISCKVWIVFRVFVAFPTVSMGTLALLFPPFSIHLEKITLIMGAGRFAAVQKRFSILSYNFYANLGFLLVRTNH